MRVLYITLLEIDRKYILDLIKFDFDLDKYEVEFVFRINAIEKLRKEFMEILNLFNIVFFSPGDFVIFVPKRIKFDDEGSKYLLYVSGKIVMWNKARERTKVNYLNMLKIIEETASDVLVYGKFQNFKEFLVHIKDKYKRRYEDRKKYKKELEEREKLIEKLRMKSGVGLNEREKLLYLEK